MPQNPVKTTLFASKIAALVGGYLGITPSSGTGIVTLNTHIWANAGAPTSGTMGTLAGDTTPGDLLIDTTNLKLYQNTGTQTSPTWTLFESSGGTVTFSAADSITAHAGGGQTSATALAAQINRVTTVATAADSVKLPASGAGAMCVVINDAANPCQVFGAGTDTINDVATGTGVSQLGKTAVVYWSQAAGTWYSTGAGVAVPGNFTTLAASSLATFAGIGSSVPQQAYNTNTNASGTVTLTAAQCAGGSVENWVNCTGTQSGAFNIDLPTVAALVAEMQTLGLNPVAGGSFILNIINTCGAAEIGTITTASGWTLNGTMTVAQNTYRKLLVTMTSLTAFSAQSLGEYTLTAGV